MSNRRYTRGSLRFGGDRDAPGGGGFLPSSISGLVWWLRGDLGVTQSASRISAWNDQSGVGDANRNALQATGANQPLYTQFDANYNNRPTVSNDTGLRYMGTGTWSTSYSQPATMFAVGQANGVRIIDGMNAGNRQGFFNIGGVWNYYAGSTFVASAVVPTNPSALCGIFNGASSSLYVNSSASTAATGNPGASPFSVAGLLATSDGVGATIGDKIAEAMYFNRILTTIEIAALFAYAGTRYGKAWS